jgi:hypothetical protein
MTQEPNDIIEDVVDMDKELEKEIEPVEDEDIQSPEPVETEDSDK